MGLKKGIQKLCTWTMVCLLLTTVLTGCGKNHSQEESVTGTWTLTGMQYDGKTYSQKDIESAGAGMTLELFEDGTGTMLYDGVTSDVTWDAEEIHTETGTDTYVLKDGILTVYDETTEMYFEKTDAAQKDTSSNKKDKDVEDNWEVTQLASSLDLVPYSCEDFTMNIPQGWVVEEAPSYAGMFHVIRVYDPDKPVNQIVYMPKAEPFFPDENVKYMFGLNNEIYGLCPVLENVSTEGIFQVFS